MTTIHEEAAEQLLQNLMGNPVSAGTLAYQRDLLARGEDHQYAARIGQTLQDPGAWPLEQVAAYTTVHTGLMSGRYVDILIGVVSEPGPDADREGNARKLLGVNERFRADLHMTQNGRNFDGWLSWTRPVETERSTGAGLVTPCATVPVRAPLSLPAGGVPLEVGTSKPSATFLHLERHGGVARWAYGDDVLALFVNVGHPKFRRSLAAKGK